VIRWQSDRYGEHVHFKRVIPCLDVDGGRVVKGVEFLDIRDAGDPVELAAHYDREGADEVVFLDITATHEKRDTIAKLARSTADEVFVPFTIGGGIRSVADAQAVLDAGADKVSVNSAALQRPELLDELANVFGAQCVVLAIDAKRAASQSPYSDGDTTSARADMALGPGDTSATQSWEAEDTPGAGDTSATPSWEAYLAGGRTATGRDVVEWAREAVERGAGEILLTSMDRDGTNDGYDLALTRAVSEAVGVPVIASGGAGELEHLVQALQAGADAVLCASIFHYGRYTVAQAKSHLAAAGIPVRTL
jgi:cyclase